MLVRRELLVYRGFSRPHSKMEFEHRPESGKGINQSYREPEGKHPRPMGSKDTNLQKGTCLARLINSRGLE